MRGFYTTGVIQNYYGLDGHTRLSLFTRSSQKKTPEKKQKREKREKKEKMGQGHLHVGVTKFCLKCLLW